MRYKMITEAFYKKNSKFVKGFKGDRLIVINIMKCSLWIIIFIAIPISYFFSDFNSYKNTLFIQIVFSVVNYAYLVPSSVLYIYLLHIENRYLGTPISNTLLLKRFFEVLSL